ncbi:MAG: glycosyltransferase family 4 protein [Phycisphaeraceae bacterium]
MRLAYLTGEYPRATDTFVQREVARLRAMGLDVRTFAARRPAECETTGPEQRAERDRTTYLLPPRPHDLLAAHLGLLLRHPRRYGRALRLAWRIRPPGLRDGLYQLFYFAEAGLLARRLRQQRVDHLHNHFANSSCTVAMLAAELADRPFSFTLHGPAIFFEPRRWRIDEKIRRARFVACISHFCRSQAMIFSPPETWSKLHIIHCGVDPAWFTPRHHTGPGQRLLFVGRLAAVKGLPVLFEAMRRVVRECPQAELALVGDGAERAMLERSVQAMGLAEHVQFVGYRSPDAVRDMLREADVFVLPSFAEGVPVVLMEAMATGVPVVATRVAGVAELVDDGVTGCLVPPGHVDALAGRIIDLLHDAGQRQRLGDAGRATVVREFNLSQEVHRLHQLFTASPGVTMPTRPHAPSLSAPAIPEQPQPLQPPV